MATDVIMCLPPVLRLPGQGSTGTRAPWAPGLHGHPDCGMALLPRCPGAQSCRGWGRGQSLSTLPAGHCAPGEAWGARTLLLWSSGETPQSWSFCSLGTLIRDMDTLDSALLPNWPCHAWQACGTGEICSYLARTQTRAWHRRGIKEQVGMQSMWIRLSALRPRGGSSFGVSVLNSQPSLVAESLLTAPWGSSSSGPSLAVVPSAAAGVSGGPARP